MICIFCAISCIIALNNCRWRIRGFLFAAVHTCDHLPGPRRPDGHIYNVCGRLIAGAAVCCILHGAAVRSIPYGDAVRCILRGTAVRRILHGDAARWQLLAQGEMAARSAVAVLFQGRARAGNNVDDIVIIGAAVCRLLLGRGRRRLLLRSCVLRTVDKLVIVDGHRPCAVAALGQGQRADSFPLAGLQGFLRALLLVRVLLLRGSRARLAAAGILAGGEKVLGGQVVQKVGEHVARQLAGDGCGGQAGEANGTQHVGRLARLLAGPERLARGVRPAVLLGRPRTEACQHGGCVEPPRAAALLTASLPASESDRGVMRATPSGSPPRGGGWSLQKCQSVDGVCGTPCAATAGCCFM